jgi:hypothetical protein
MSRLFLSEKLYVTAEKCTALGVRIPATGRARHDVVSGLAPFARSFSAGLGLTFTSVVLAGRHIL